MKSSRWSLTGGRLPAPALLESLESEEALILKAEG